MKTFMAKPAEIKRDWYVIDATGISLGRVATKAANVLRGKHKAIYTPNVDCGDYVIVINADKVKLDYNTFFDQVYFLIRLNLQEINLIKKCIIITVDTLVD